MADPVTTRRPALVEGARASRTSIALKLLMAVSGLAFVGFVVGHMYGNLKAFSGHDAFNEYAHHLRELGEPLLPHMGFIWIMRVGLLVALIIHVVAAIELTRRARKARPVRYVVKKHTGAIPASRLMRWGGLTLFLFIVWHLVNFTFGKVNVKSGDTGDAAGDPYDLLVDTFDVWWMTLIYLAAMAMLGAHLHHGVWSSLQTLGMTGTAASRARAKTISFAIAILIAGGFSLVPIAVLAGIID